MPEQDTARPLLTQRAALASGRHGHFAAALYKVATSGSIYDLMRAFERADEHNRAALERVFPESFHICQVIYNQWPGRAGWLAALARMFPRHLGGDLDGPVRFDEARAVVVNIEAAPGGDEVEG